MTNLRKQIILSQLALVALMLAVMVGAVARFVHLGHAIDRILQANYKSVIAAQEMKEALERQDSAVTFYLAGQTQKAVTQYRANGPKFKSAYVIEANNITETGEGKLVVLIADQYSAYSAAAEKLLFANPPMAMEAARDYYFRELEPSFIKLKETAQRVLDLNQAAIVRANQQAKSEADNASRTGITVACAAVLFAIGFGLKSANSALAPLRSLARQAEEVGAGHLNQRIEINRSDEIGVLANAFNAMAVNLSDSKKRETERLVRAERMSDAAIDSLYDPVIVTDPKGAIVHLNPAAEPLFGELKVVVGRPVNQVVTDERIASAILAAAQEAHIFASEDEAGFVDLNIGESTRTYRLRATPMLDDEGEVVGATAVLEDVTQMRQVDRMKSDFIGVASHELRTPVTSLRLAVDLLSESTTGSLNAEQWEIIQSQRRDLSRLEQTMQDLLDVTRLEAGSEAPERKKVSVNRLLDTAIASVTMLAEQKGVEVTSECTPKQWDLLVDGAQWVRALVNLLNNAIRHTPKGGTIKLTAHRTDISDLLTVQDTGEGIPSEYLENIFDRFVQVPGATGGGTGLGLSIVKSIVKAHGGDIKVESRPGVGSTFTIEMPAPTESKEQKDG